MNFDEYKRKKERGLSNKEFLEMITQYFQESETIVVTGVGTNGTIETFYTSASQLTAIGMMEVAKEQLISEMEV